jgi:hypothetical protein
MVDTSPLPGLAYANGALAYTNIFAASSLHRFRARRGAALLAYANLLILWVGHFVCALFETVVASQVSRPVGEKESRIYPGGPRQSGCRWKQDGPAWGWT